MDDSILVACPQCGVSLKAPAGLAGRAVKCPSCSAVTRVPEPQPAAAAPQGAPRPAPVVRANRAVAGKPCPACGREVMLGDEIVACTTCGEASHAACWEARGGCASPACAQGQAPSPQAEPRPTPLQGGTIPCPACAEQIRADAKVCPYCSEPLDASSEEWPMPREFQAKSGFFGRKWRIQLQDEELVATALNGRDEMRVRRADAARDVILNKRKLVLHADRRKRRFMVDDLGNAAIRFWISRRAVPEPSILARDALMQGIVGIFIFRPILGTAAIVQGIMALQLIKRHPRLFMGRGSAIAAIVIGGFDLLVTILLIIVIIALSAAG